MALNLPELVNDALDFIATDQPERAKYNLRVLLVELAIIQREADHILGEASIEQPNLTHIAQRANHIVKKVQDHG